MEHVYEEHVKSKLELRTVRCVSPDLTRYLEFLGIVRKGKGSVATECADDPKKWERLSEGAGPVRKKPVRTGSQTSAHAIAYANGGCGEGKPENYGAGC